MEIGKCIVKEVQAIPFFVYVTLKDNLGNGDLCLKDLDANNF